MDVKIKIFKKVRAGKTAQAGENFEKSHFSAFCEK